METIKNEIIKKILERGYQIEPEAFKLLQEIENNDIPEIIDKILESKKTESSKISINMNDIANLMPILEEKNENGKKILINSEVKIIKNLSDKITVSEGKEGYKNLFCSRYNKLLKIVTSRFGFHNIDNIMNLEKSVKEGKKRVAGLVLDVKMKRSSTIISLDDSTGILEAVVIDRDIINSVKEVLLDSLIVAEIEYSKRKIAILKSFVLPDIPEHIPSLSSKKVYAVLTSVLHIGSKNFLCNEFLMFINWLKGKEDNEIVSRIKYIVIAGDNIDGIGVYPGQENELKIKDIKGQYDLFSNLIKQVPDTIDVFIIPGNHDAVRQALPQPSIPMEYLNELGQESNITILGNPSLISLHGVKILVYHGRSLDDVMATSPGLSFNRPAIAMRSLIKTRHLAPIYGERTALLPTDEDSLIIEEVPDIFHAGHIHILDSEKYRGVLIINSGSWQSQTPYQARMGIFPTPGIVPIIDLSTLNVISKNFLNKGN